MQHLKLLYMVSEFRGLCLGMATLPADVRASKLEECL